LGIQSGMSKVWCYSCKDWQRVDSCPDAYLDIEDVPNESISKEMKWFDYYSPWDNYFIEVDGVCYFFGVDKNGKWNFKHCDYWLDVYMKRIAKATTPTAIHQKWMEMRHKTLNEVEW